MKLRPYVVTMVLALALLAGGCGDDETEEASGSRPAAQTEGGGSAALSAQEGTTVATAFEDLQSTCGKGKKTAAVDRNVQQLLDVYEQRGPNATLPAESGVQAKDLDAVMVQVLGMLQKCAAIDESAKVLGARAAKGRF